MNGFDIVIECHFRMPWFVYGHVKIDKTSNAKSNDMAPSVAQADAILAQFDGALAFA